jgi:N-acetylmuramoyl-L-alanine amidase
MNRAFEIIATIVFASFCFSAMTHNPETKKRVVIDVGHGGEDDGQTVNGISEKDVVLAIALNLVELNTRADVEIILLRTEDRTLSLKERADKVNKLNPDLAISLHANGSPDDSKNGVEAYVFSESIHFEQSKLYADQILDAVSKDNLTKNGVKQARFYVLQNIQCPVVLLEVGFLTNEANRAYIESAEGQREIALGILCAL